MSLAPTLNFPKFPFLPYLPTFRQFFPLPFPTVPIHSPSTSLPSFSLPYLPCPFCSSLISIFVFSSQPSRFPRNISLSTFPFPTFPFHTFPLPYLYPSLPTCPLISPLISFPPYLNISFPILPHPSLSFAVTLPLLLFIFSPFPFLSLFPSLPLILGLWFPSLPQGGGEGTLYTPAGNRY